MVTVNTWSSLPAIRAEKYSVYVKIIIVYDVTVY